MSATRKPVQREYFTTPAPALREGSLFTKDLPFYRWYPADAETDERYRSMTDEECGFFHHCLNISWMNNGLPSDPAARARCLGRHRNQADARWTPLIASCFKPHPNREGYLANTRQERERVHAESKSVKCSISAKTKSERSLRASDSDSDSVFDLDFKKEKIPILDDFGRFAEICHAAELPASEVDLKAAKFEWGRLDFQQKLDAVQGLKDRISGGELSDPSFRPLPQNYLKQRIWQRPIRVKTQKQQSKSKLELLREEAMQDVTRRLG